MEHYQTIEQRVCDVLDEHETLTQNECVGLIRAEFNVTHDIALREIKNMTVHGSSVTFTTDGKLMKVNE